MFIGNAGNAGTLLGASSWPVQNANDSAVADGLVCYNPFLYGNIDPLANAVGIAQGYWDQTNPPNNTNFLVPNSGVVPTTRGFVDTGVNFTVNTVHLTSINPPNNLPLGSSPRTVTMWFEPPNATGATRLFFYGNSGTSLQAFSLYIPTAGAVAGQTAGTIGLDVAAIQAWGNTVVSANVPNFVAVTNSGTVASTTMWLNGIAQSITNNGSGSLNTQTTTALEIQNGPSLTGAVIAYDIRVYNRVLSPGEIFEIQARGFWNRPLRLSQTAEMPALSLGTSKLFRRTLSQIGTRPGSRQIQGYMNG